MQRKVLMFRQLEKQKKQHTLRQREEDVQKREVEIRRREQQLTTVASLQQNRFNCNS